MTAPNSLLLRCSVLLGAAVLPERVAPVGRNYVTEVWQRHSILSEIGVRGKKSSHSSFKSNIGSPRSHISEFELFPI